MLSRQQKCQPTALDSMHLDPGFWLLLILVAYRLEEHVEWSGPETLRKFDKHMFAATEGLKEGLHWGELMNAGGSPAPLLAIHTSHPTEQVCCAHVPRISCCVVAALPSPAGQ